MHLSIWLCVLVVTSLFMPFVHPYSASYYFFVLMSITRAAALTYMISHQQHQTTQKTQNSLGMLFPHRVESVGDRVNQAWMLVIRQLCLRWALRAIVKAIIRNHFLSTSPTCFCFHAKHKYNPITTTNCIRGIITHLLSNFVRITLEIWEGHRNIVEHAI